MLDLLESLPESTKAQILPHQELCVERAIKELNCKCLITLGMGQGKTMVGCILAHLLHRTHSLIIVPKNVVNNWKAEFKRWIWYDLVDLKQHRGEPLRGIVITSISTARTWIEKHKYFRYDCIVVDECQALKGEESIQARVIVNALITSHSCFLLSGTPCLNRPSELYNLLRAVRPNDFPSRQKFKDQFCQGITGQFAGSRFFYRETGIKPGMEGILADLVASVSCRPDVSHKLPPLKRYKRTKTATDENIERELKGMSELATELAEKQANARDQQEFDTVTQQMQVHANASLIRAGEIKVDVFGDMIEDLIMGRHRDEGIAIFCYYANAAEMLRDAIRVYYPDVSLTTGLTSTSERNTNISNLASGKVRVGILSYGVGGVGINLVPAVSVCIFLELNQVPENMAQAEKRAHRMGQTKPVSTYWCVLQNSRDVQVFRNLQQKKKTCSQILDAPSLTFLFNEEE